MSVCPCVCVPVSPSICLCLSGCLAVCYSGRLFGCRPVPSVGLCVCLFLCLSAVCLTGVGRAFSLPVCVCRLSQDWHGRCTSSRCHSVGRHAARRLGGEGV
jgi:hypothetical protein